MIPAQLRKRVTEALTDPGRSREMWWWIIGIIIAAVLLPVLIGRVLCHSRSPLHYDFP